MVLQVGDRLKGLTAARVGALEGTYIGGVCQHMVLEVLLLLE